MPTFRFSVKVNNVAKVLAVMPSIMNKTLNEIGDAAVKYADAKAPIDTGALSMSYAKDVHSNYVRVGSPLEYAPYVELGTGPNYDIPPGWVTNNAVPGHHLTDPWWYLDDTGTWTLGWFVRPRPHLQPAFTDHVDEYKRIFKYHLQHA